MTTPRGSTAPVDSDPERTPLRIRMAGKSATNKLDGGWWPQSRDLAVELADLVAHFPAEQGRIVRALVSPPDWDPAPRRIPIGRGYIKVGSFPHDDTHLIHLNTADRAVLHVLVVPPGLSGEQGEEAMLAAATSGNSHSAGELLREVTDSPEHDAAGRWSDG